VYDYCKIILLLYILTTSVYTEDSDCAETCRTRLMVICTICRMVHVWCCLWL